MERENFYILLELSLQPPETDAEVIWEAIQNKKADWSRLRNHPTKGLQAQKNINLIPEIQRVMMNNELREKEVLNALEILKKGKESKFVEIDRHIDMLMAKGYIAKEEISKLAEMHNIALNEIQSRVTAKKMKILHESTGKSASIWPKAISPRRKLLKSPNDNPWPMMISGSGSDAPSQKTTRKN